MSYTLYCSMCGHKAASGLRNKTARALCPKHLGMARFMDALIEDRISDMPLEPLSFSSEVTRV